MKQNGRSNGGSRPMWHELAPDERSRLDWWHLVGCAAAATSTLLVVGAGVWAIRELVGR